MPLITRRKAGQSISVFTKEGRYIGKITIEKISSTGVKVDLSVDGADEIRLYRSELLEEKEIEGAEHS